MTSPASFGPKSRPILTLALLDPANPGGQVGRAWTGELTSCLIEPDTGSTSITSTYDGDDAAPWYLKGEAIQSTAASSLWRFVWDHSGEVVSYTLAPNGNTIATTDQPILAGELTIGPRPQLGGAASDKTFTFEFDWKLTDEPTLNDGTGA